MQTATFFAFCNTLFHAAFAKSLWHNELRCGIPIAIPIMCGADQNTRIGRCLKTESVGHASLLEVYLQSYQKGDTMSAYFEAVKFGMKSRNEVRSFIADASATAEAEKGKKEKLTAMCEEKGMTLESYIELSASLGVVVKLDSDSEKRAQAAYKFARAHILGVLDEMFSEIGKNDNRTPSDFLRLARKVCELSEKIDMFTLENK